MASIPNSTLPGKRRRRILAPPVGVIVGLAVLVSMGWAEAAVDANSHLRLVRTITLEKSSGRVDQIVPLPGGGFAVRDADFFKPETQSLEIYGADGAFIRKVSELGRGPGKYFRLRGLAASADSTLWEADLTKINLFGTDGAHRKTVLIQRPGYQLTSLVLDEERGVFYLAGCVPLHTYLNNGCTLLHQYRLDNHRLQKSMVETDLQALENNWLPLEWYTLDVDHKGSVYLIDGPVHKLFKADPQSGTVESFPIASEQMKPTPLLFPMNTTSHDKAYRDGFLLDKVAAVGDRVVVSVRKPRWEGYLLQVFDSTGRQIGIDIEAPGRLVGKTKDASLLFARTVAGRNRVEILEYVY